MIEFKDKSGRLLVVLRTGRREFGVFVNGRCVEMFRSGKEALDHARFLAERPPRDRVECDSTPV